MVLYKRKIKPRIRLFVMNETFRNFKPNFIPVNTLPSTFISVYFRHPFRKFVQKKEIDGNEQFLFAQQSYFFNTFMFHVLMHLIIWSVCFWPRGFQPRLIRVCVRQLYNSLPDYEIHDLN